MSSLAGVSTDDRLLRIGQGVGLALCGILLAANALTVVLWFVYQPSDIAYAAWSTEAGLSILAGWGIPVSWWIAYLVLPTIGLLVISVGAALLVLRAELSWFRIYLAVALVLFATVGSDLVLVSGAIYPQTSPYGEMLQGLGWFGLFLLAYVFPDGRFVPSWSRWFAVSWLAYLVLSVTIVIEDHDILRSAEPVLILVLFGSCVGSQAYRYARVSGRLERQQTRWLLVAVTLWFSVALVLYVTSLRSSYSEPSERGLVTFAALSLVTSIILWLFPIAVAVAILQYRLYDIDIWINRTLLYVALTGFVIATYVVVVTAAGRIGSGAGTVAAPLAAAIVALTFSPVRAWVQQRVNRLVYGEREDPYRVLSQLGQQLESLARPEALAPAIVDSVVLALKAPYVAVWLDSPGSIVASTGSEMSDVERFDLRHGGELLGQLLVGRRSRSDRYSSGDRRLLADLTRHAGIALHAARESERTTRLAADLQLTRERLVNSREEERRHLRRNLHDSIGSAIGSQAMTIDVARSLLRADPDAADAILLEIKGQSQQTLATVRQIARELRPPVLDELGLLAALAHLQETCQQRGLQVHLCASRIPVLPAAVEVAAYRIAEESLTNIIRHAKAGCCTLSVATADDRICLSISDDGKGIAQDSQPGVGTVSMRERAEELGGMFRIESIGDGGTRVLVQLPLPEGRDQ